MDFLTFLGDDPATRKRLLWMMAPTIHDLIARIPGLGDTYIHWARFAIPRGWMKCSVGGLYLQFVEGELTDTQLCRILRPKQTNDFIFLHEYVQKACDTGNILSLLTLFGWVPSMERSISFRMEQLNSLVENLDDKVKRARSKTNVVSRND